MIWSRLASAALAGIVGLSIAAPPPALADGAASTRNIFFGAAALGGVFSIVNHTRKVHQKQAELDRRQRELQSERDAAQAAYRFERSAYRHEVALARSYRKQIAYERGAIYRRDLRIAFLKHSLMLAKYGSARRTAFAQPPAPARPAAPRVRSLRSPAHTGPPRPAAIASRIDPSAGRVSYVWGSF